MFYFLYELSGRVYIAYRVVGRVCIQTAICRTRQGTLCQFYAISFCLFFASKFVLLYPTRKILFCIGIWEFLLQFHGCFFLSLFHLLYQLLGFLDKNYSFKTLHVLYFPSPLLIMPISSISTGLSHPTILTSVPSFFCHSATNAP